MPVVVLAALEEDVDLVAGLDRRLRRRACVNSSSGICPFGLVADVDDDVVLADVDHAASDDVAFLDVFLLEGLFEQCGEALLLSGCFWVAVETMRYASAFRART